MFYFVMLCLEKVDTRLTSSKIMCILSSNYIIKNNILKVRFIYYETIKYIIFCGMQCNDILCGPQNIV